MIDLTLFAKISKYYKRFTNKEEFEIAEKGYTIRSKDGNARGFVDVSENEYIIFAFEIRDKKKCNI